MRKQSLIAITFALFFTSCAPATGITQVPTETPAPLSTPTATESIILENPPACAGANIIYHSQLQEALLIGCIPSSVRQSRPNIIWGWNGQRWRHVTEGGPQMLLLGGAAYDEKRNVLVMYGGYSWAKNSCERETWEWDGQTWTKKDVESPTACDHLEMIYDASREQVILFGGGDENHNLSAETWSWDGEAWTLISDTGPPGRAHFGFVYDPVHEQGLLYGGYADTIIDDFWGWKDGAWQPLDFPGPGPLSHIGMASDHAANELILFGGASSTSTFSSLSDQTWRLTNGSWSELSLEDHPSARGSPAMVYDPQRERIVLYGGFVSNRSDLDDTWEWDGNEWHCIVNCGQ
jgi:hypothetical protein